MALPPSARTPTIRLTSATDPNYWYTARAGRIACRFTTGQGENFKSTVLRIYWGDGCTPGVWTPDQFPQERSFTPQVVRIGPGEIEQRRPNR